METLLAMPSFRDKFPIQDHSTNMPLCMPDEYKTDNLVESYRNFFANKPNLRYFTQHHLSGFLNTAHHIYHLSKDHEKKIH